jgi:hypothetical protein
MEDVRFGLDAIRPLVTHENPTGRQLVVTFSCPVSGRHVQARWSAPESSGLGAQVASRAGRNAWYEVRRQAHSVLYGIFGHGAIARIAVGVVDQALQSAPTATSAPPLSRAARDRGIVEAFRSVAAEFAWVGGRWVHKTAVASVLSPFERQIHEHPLATAWDRTVGARIALEVCAAHGGISEAERDELETNLDPTIGSLESLQSRPPLTRAELAETSTGPVRVTLLALGWSFALCDESFEPAEGERLDAIAQGLGLSEPDRLRARDLARSWVLDQWFERAFSWGGHDTHLREQAIAVGARIGLSRDEVETAEARFQRRRAG